MPGREAAANRYAQAVFAIARDDNAFDRWQADLATLRALAADPTAAAFLRSTKTDEASKFQLLERVLTGAGPKALSFAKLLVRKHRTDIAGQIADAFDEMVNAERGAAVARVTTAVQLTDDGRSAIVAAIRRTTGATEVRLEEVVNRDILGGAIVQIGDHIIDGSVRTRLSGLRRSIAGSTR